MMMEGLNLAKAKGFKKMFVCISTGFGFRCMTQIGFKQVCRSENYLDMVVDGTKIFQPNKEIKKGDHASLLTLDLEEWDPDEYIALEECAEKTEDAQAKAEEENRRKLIGSREK